MTWLADIPWPTFIAGLFVLGGAAIGLVLYWVHLRGRRASGAAMIDLVERHHDAVRDSAGRDLLAAEREAQRILADAHARAREGVSRGTSDSLADSLNRLDGDSES